MKNKVILVCKDCNSRNYSFTYALNSKKSLDLNKYCPICRRSTLHNGNR